MCLTLYYKALRVTFLKELCVVVVVQQSSTDFTHFSGKFFDAEKCILILLVSKFSLLRNVQKMHFKHVVVVGRLVAKVFIKLLQSSEYNSRKSLFFFWCLSLLHGLIWNFSFIKFCEKFLPTFLFRTSHLLIQFTINSFFIKQLMI